MSSLSRYKESKKVLSGGLPYYPLYKGVTEDDSIKLIREGVTGGNLRGHVDEVTNTLVRYYQEDRRQNGIYQQFVQDSKLVEEIVSHFKQRGIPATADEIVIGSGATQIFAGCCAYIKTKAQYSTSIIVTETPFYHSFALTPPYYDLDLVPLRTLIENNHKLSPADLRCWIKQQNDVDAAHIRGVLLFCPTLLGEDYSLRELSNLLLFFAQREEESKNSLPLFIEDTVYEGISLEGDFTPSSDCASMARVKVDLQSGASIDGANHTVVIGSLSKSYCAPNIRVGFARAPSEIASFLRSYITAHQVEVPRDHQRAALAALVSTPKRFFIDNNREYRRRVDLVVNHLLNLNNKLHQSVSKLLLKSLRLREIFRAQGSLDEHDQFKSDFQFVSLYHYPKKANIVYLDFKNCSGLSATELMSEEIFSPIKTKVGAELNNSLALTRELMDRVDSNGKHCGIALSPGWALGFHRGQERFICKLQIAQFGQPAAVAHDDGRVDCLVVDKIFSDLFLRMEEGLEELFARQ
jgi:aspartate/methionine/tyrosine aminotransferase